MLFLSNAFSLSMLPADAGLLGMRFLPLSPEVAKLTAENSVRSGTFQSVVGHVSTAAVFASVLGCEVPENRVSLRLDPGDTLLVGQYAGPRLPEGATELPEGASIQWWLVFRDVRGEL